MNYKKVYDQLIEKRRKFPLTKNKKDPNYVYCETHHIIPKCLNGTDDISNKINLTAREHFIAHYLLWKIYPCDETLLAFYMFKKGNPHSCVKRDFKNSKLYEKARLAYNEWNVRIHTGKPGWNKGMKNQYTIKKRTLEQRKHLSEISYWKGKHRSAETKAKISEQTKKGMASIPPDKKQEMIYKTRQKLKGMLHWNNGVIGVRSKECPGLDFKRGMLPKSLREKNKAKQ